MGSCANPVQVLQEIETRSRSSAAELPKLEKQVKDWTGIAFEIGDARLIAPLDEVSELLTLPEMTRIPGAKDWVKGIANVRGNLIPVMDLSGYLHGRETRINRRSRILVVDHEGVMAGLVVDVVHGMRHFIDDNRSEQLPSLDAALLPYVTHAYHMDDNLWAVFSMHALAESPTFMQVAV